jgi:MerR family transcriptional regulator/heat shock protein HspR
VISVAAKLLKCHPQTLRMYEREGLLEPRRSRQNRRLYSDDDLERIRQIRRLTQDLGVNIAGVDIILDLLDQVQDLQAEIDRLQSELVRRTALVPRQLKGKTTPPRQAKIVEIE